MCALDTSFANPGSAQWPSRTSRSVLPSETRLCSVCLAPVQPRHCCPSRAQTATDHVQQGKRQPEKIRGRSKDILIQKVALACPYHVEPWHGAPPMSSWVHSRGLRGRAGSRYISAFVGVHFVHASQTEELCQTTLSYGKPHSQSRTTAMKLRVWHHLCQRQHTRLKRSQASLGL